MLVSTNYVNIAVTLCRLRCSHARSLCDVIVCCVQAQYIFLHNAILEGVRSGKTTIPAEMLRDHVHALAKVHLSTGKTGFEQEFRVSAT